METEDEARRVLSAVRRLTGTFTELGHRFGEQHGLSRSDVSALVVITEVTEHGADIGIVELARRIGVTAPSATVLVDRLAAAGLLERRPHPTDRRRVVLSLTPAARAAGSDHFGALDARLMALLAAHPPGDLRVAADLLAEAADLAATVASPTQEWEKPTPGRTASEATAVET